MSLSRRTFLGAGTAAALCAPAIVRAQGFFLSYPFQLGVAAGDPSPDGFVIWTRLAPEPLGVHGGMPMSAIPVKWEVAEDQYFTKMVRDGEEQARPELGHSVHVELAGLQPDRPYWYRFRAGGERSITGRARTLPALSASPAALRFGVAGCQNWEDGYFTAFRHLAAEDLAFVYHYGDYIYEYRGNPVRPGRGGDLIVAVRLHEGQALYDLADYRRRYGQYKSDPDLQRAHAAHAWFNTFDDHEIDDNWASDADNRGTPAELFRTRRAAALQAWYEHMPVRRASMPRYGAAAFHRSARYGDLAEINFLDTRQYRTNQPCEDGFKPACPGVRDQAAAVLGAEQEAWLARNLSRRQTRWNCLAQQIMMMSLDRRTRDEPEKILNLDSWAAYEVPRARLLARMRGLDNVVVLTGDEHQNYAGLLEHEGRVVAAEIVSTSIASGGDGSDLRPGSDRLLAGNPQLKFINDQRGYVVCDVGRDAWRADFMTMDKVQVPGGLVSRRASATIPHGRPGLEISS